MKYTHIISNAKSVFLKSYQEEKVDEGIHKLSQSVKNGKNACTKDLSARVRLAPKVPNRSAQ